MSRLSRQCMAPAKGLVGQQSWVRAFASRRRRESNWIGSGEKKASVTCPDELATIAKELKVEARRLGFGLTGVTSARPAGRVEQYEKWLEAGHHGELGYLSRSDRVARRKDPSLILPGAKAVVMVGLFYWPGRSGFPAEHAVSAHAAVGSDAGVVSSYAWGADYHGAMNERLAALGRWLHARAGGVGRFYADTGAVLERDFGERAGLGFVGKNTLLINPVLGSGFFIGELFTTVALPLDGDSERGTMATQRGKPGCGKCTKCSTACPTGAIVDDYVLDARRCISYLTIELKGDIPRALRPLVGNKVYGCDICQQVCPWNRLDWTRPAPSDAGAAFSPLFGSPAASVTTPRLTRLLRLTRAEFDAEFARSPILRIGRARLSRNAAVALGNVGTASELPALRAVATGHDEELVRTHAQWAVGQIEGRQKSKVA